MPLTEQQIIMLAPDASSAKAGRDLARATKWVTAGSDDRALWGECQGSGAKPYQTGIDLSEPAFKCTCPSRKFPCKHALGLLLLSSSSPAATPAGSPPPWVQEWLDSRAAKSEAKTKRDETLADDSADEKPATTRTTVVKSVLARETKIADGLAQVELWLQDIVRGGLADFGSRSAKQINEQAARLVDAQAPGLARLVKELHGYSSAGADWHANVLERLGLIYLAIEGYKRQNDLPSTLRADVRSSIGWTQSQDDVLARDAVHDTWSVVGAQSTEEDRLTVQRYWLWGESSKQFSLIMNFVHASAPVKTLPLATGMAFEGEVVYTESHAPLRAVVRSRQPVDSSQVPEFSSLVDSIAVVAGRVAQQPWLVHQPVGLAGGYPALDASGNWRIVDANTHSWLPIAPSVEPLTLWRLAALCGHAPTSIFGEWDGSHFIPLTAWPNGVARAL